MFGFIRQQKLNELLVELANLRAKVPQLERSLAAVEAAKTGLQDRLAARERQPSKSTAHGN